jgi:hypothetical protein
MADPAVFQGSLVNLKNSPTHKSVILQVEIPEEYGEAIVRAFGWPTRVKPLPVAVARLEEGMPNKSEPKPEAEPRRFDRLSPAEQAGILCKEERFAEFLRTTSPYRPIMEKGQKRPCASTAAWIAARTSRKGQRRTGQWRVILKHYRRWQDERDRLDVDF